MSITAALVEGHYFMSLARMGEKWARCQCGVEFEWNDRDKAHALHLLDVVRADHEKAVRERIAQDILAEADRIDPSDDWPEDGFTAAYTAHGLRQAARIASEGVAP